MKRFSISKTIGSFLLAGSLVTSSFVPAAQGAGWFNAPDPQITHKGTVLLSPAGVVQDEAHQKSRGWILDLGTIEREDRVAEATGASRSSQPQEPITLQFE